MKRTRSRTDQNKFIAFKTWVHLVTGLVAMGLLPLVSFIWALIKANPSSLWFWWNMINFGNCICLFYTTQSATLMKVVVLAMNPDKKPNESEPPSVVVKECPTRKFVVGGDIFTLSWYLCMKKKVFRAQNILESEIPTRA